MEESQTPHTFEVIFLTAAAPFFILACLLCLSSCAIPYSLTSKSESEVLGKEHEFFLGRRKRGISARLNATKMSPQGAW